MKRFLATTLTILLLLSTTTQAAIELPTIKPSIEVNGTKYECIIKDGSTYMPIRAVFEALGFSVDWDANTKSITIYNNDMVHIILTSKNEVYHQSVETVIEDGHEMPKYFESGEFEHKIVFEDSKTYLPFRKLLESMGYTIGWDGETKTATVKGVGKEPSSYSLTETGEFLNGKAKDLAIGLGYENPDDMMESLKDKFFNFLKELFLGGDE